MSNNYNRSFNNPGTFYTKNWVDVVAENNNITKFRTVDNRSGEETPNYRELAAKGQLPMLPFSYRRYKRHGAEGARVFTDLVGTYDYGTYSNYGDWNALGGGLSGTLATPMNFNSTDRDSFQDLATIKALNDVKSQKVNILQDLGEAKQTLNLLTSTAGRLFRGYSRFRRGDLIGAAKALGAAKPSRRFRKKYERSKTGLFREDRKKLYGHVPEPGLLASVFSPTNLSSLWLEFNYGWRPLVSSVQGAFELFHQQIVSGEIIRIQSTWKTNVIDVDTGTWEVYYGWKSEWTNTSQRNYSVKHVLYYTVSDVQAVTLSQAGLSNLPNLAWELVPFSFVVDWFINVGAFLSSLDATNGLTFVKGCVTTCEKVNAVRTSESISTIPDETACSGSQVSTIKDFRLNRAVLNDFPAPRTPSFTQRSLGLNKYLTSVALLTSIFFGGGKQPLYRMR